jgi:hypothetical protein
MMPRFLGVARVEIDAILSLMNRSWMMMHSIARSAAVTCSVLGSGCAMSSPWT